jgi:hypothetical protein
MFGLISNWTSVVTPIGWARTSSLEQHDESKPLDSTVVVTDFNHDGQPDRATLRLGIQRSQVEIQFGQQDKRISFDVVNHKLAVGLVASDVDRDGDKDLVIASTRTFRPVAVWLSDGHDHFKRVYRRSRVRKFSLSFPFKDIPSNPNPDSSQIDQICVCLDAAFPFDISIPSLVSNDLETGNPIPIEWQKPSVQLLQFTFTIRGPPPHITL